MTIAQLFFAIAGLQIALLGLFKYYVDEKFKSIDKRFDAIDRRFDDMREIWRSELNRVEGVLDARLKHLEESR